MELLLTRWLSRASISCKETQTGNDSESPFFIGKRWDHMGERTLYSRKRMMRLIGAILGALFIVAADRCTKAWAVTALRNRPSQEILGNFLQFEYIENRGAAFGILTDQRIFFVILTLAIVAALIYFLFRQGLRSAIATTGIALIIGGAFGNFIDRLLQGYVVDFIRVDLVSFYEFPVFNIADIGITVGCALLFVYFLWIDRKKEDAA